MVPPNERWQINAQLAELGMNENRQIINDSKSSWAQNQNYSSDRTEKTKFQVMAEVSASTSMISAALLQAYAYQTFEYQEIFRRLCRKNSRDADCREFRANCLRLGIPEEYLIPEAWEIEAERVMGAGNKTMELAIAEQLWSMREAYDPAAQREILRDVTLLITDDAVRTRAYVPEGPRPVSNSEHDAELSLAVIMQGKQVRPVDGQNHKEVITVWLAELGKSVQAIEAQGGMTSPQELMGLKNLSLHIKAQIAIVARDENEKENVKKWMDALGKLDNFLKGYEQRLIEAQKKAAQQQGNGGQDPKEIAKAQNMMMQGQIKAQNQRESHAQRMAQRQLQFEQEQRQKAQEHKVEMAKARVDTLAKVAATDMQTAAQIKRDEAKSKMKSFSE